ncbi:VWA domain-containing protein [Maribacter chungangensis]|uniref:VWA domain-containing protein n=1 Tax=Maribacter chungangensis TaxID=1069117 RepID=A0ABW3B3G8_9FLAO
MKHTHLFLAFLIIGLLLVSCDNDAAGDESVLSATEERSDGSESFASDSGSATTPTGNGNGNGTGGEAGLVTAAEWNDLDNWSFWKELLQTEDFANKADLWNFHNLNRISVLVKNETGAPVNDTPVSLQKDGTIIWEAKTDNFGTAELLIGSRQSISEIAMEDYTLFIDNKTMPTPVKLFDEGINEFVLANTDAAGTKVELAFIVDATGSMSDELEFLKKDLLSVIEKVEQESPSLDIMTASVFYRDEGDDYVVKHSGFASSTKTTLDFIRAQSADGGGDFPEAVHTALNTALSELQWSGRARTRIAFLLLDAPPHNNTSVIGQLQNAIMEAAKKGIKIIPITASGIDKETEYLMRSFSIATNGTYVFITNDSGIGNDHLEASVGEYQVEKLNDLMVRLITKYSE